MIVLLSAATGLVFLRSESWTTIAFAVITGAVILRTATRYTRRRVVVSLFDGIAIYLIASVVLYYAFDLRSPGADSRLGGLISADGAERAFFPLATSLNLPPMMAAAFLAGCLLLMETGPKMSLRFAGVACAIVILLASGARTPLAIAALIAVLSLIAPRVLRLIAVPVAVTSFAFPKVFPYISELLLVPILDRVAPLNSDPSLNGRDFIWEQSLARWEQLDTWQQLWGYGPQGQLESGASAAYASQFGTAFENPLAATVHHSLLQQLFDGGIVGALSLGVAALIACLLWNRRISADRDIYSYAGLAMTLGLILASVTEVSLAPGIGQETFWIFTCLAIAAATASNRGRGERPVVADRYPVARPARRPEYQ
jgi:O-antigen ligase